jgi:hypothetical protein
LQEGIAGTEVGGEVRREVGEKAFALSFCNPAILQFCNVKVWC